MNKENRVSHLLGSLETEIAGATAGSDAGQFPILDLIGNLRLEFAGIPERAALHSLCAEAWERVVRIVETSQPFNEGDVLWLRELLGQIQSGVASGSSIATSIAAATTPAPALNLTFPLASVSTGESPITLNIAEDGDLLREFITESREHLDNIERGVLILEKAPADAETLNTIFRAFHTFKGGAGFLNLVPVNHLAHVLESLLDLARQGPLVIDATIIDLILRGRDLLKRIIDEIEGQLIGAEPAAAIAIPVAALKREVQSAIDRVNAGAGTPVETAQSDTTPALAAEIVDVAPKARSTERVGMVKVDTAKLDGLLDLVGEMVIAQSLVGQGLGGVSGGSQQFARNLAQLSRITRELQRVSMSLRMVPVRAVFQRMARVVRDISVKQNKQVNFVTVGEDAELDRGVVEVLGDPLLHMIRNAMDHGIESTAKRIAAGKSPVARLDLRAYHQGGNIVVEIQDDGAGLNHERILKKAIERGLTSAGKVHTDDEIASFIFAPGFSTAEVVTDLSGRGVGLDVVRRNIEKLRGGISVSSKPGQGTLCKITLPLTLAIIDALIVKVGEERYIIPTLSVRESFRPQADMITRVQDRVEVVNVRGRLIPLLRLHELFGIQPKTTDATQSIVIVLQSGPDVRCLLVDALLHKQEVVIKNLNEVMVHKNRALAGAAILGDGRVGLILDVNALVHLDVEPTAKAA